MYYNVHGFKYQNIISVIKLQELCTLFSINAVTDGIFFMEF